MYRDLSFITLLLGMLVALGHSLLQCQYSLLLTVARKSDVCRLCSAPPIDTKITATTSVRRRRLLHDIRIGCTSGGSRWITALCTGRFTTLSACSNGPVISGAVLLIVVRVGRQIIREVLLKGVPIPRGLVSELDTLVAVTNLLSCGLTKFINCVKISFIGNFSKIIKDFNI